MDSKQETMMRAIAAARKMRLIADAANVSHIVGVIPKRYLSTNDFPTPQDGVAIPDVALQIVQCLADDQRMALIGVLRDRFGPNADIRGGCVDHQERIGVWLQAPADPIDDMARTAGVAQLSIASENAFAFFLGSGFVMSRAQATFASMQKVLGTNGQPVQGGPINLTAIETKLTAPDKIETRVAGYDTEVWPSLNFHVVITDTLVATGGTLQCSSETKFEKDTGGFWGLALFFPIPFLVEAVGVQLATSPSGLGGGAGCAVAGLLPRQILTSTGKTVLSYTNAEVSEIGIVVQGGFIQDVARDPTIQIAGSTFFWLRTYLNEHFVNATYAIVTSDLAEPLAATWIVDGVAQQGQSVLTLKLTVPPDAKDKISYFHKIGVHVTDADNYSADAEINVALQVTSARPPPLDGPVILRPKRA
jgi:hypothetical protein